MASDEDYALAERENDNLRRILRRFVPLLAEPHREALAAELDRPIDEGGVVEDAHDDAVERENAMVKLLAAIAKHFEPAAEGQTLPPNWHARADHLLNQAREYTPRRPLMKRVGTYPNVYEIVRKETFS
jgi:HPt (histidine-containing phosphotransfer) domain-containing protein